MSMGFWRLSIVFIAPLFGMMFGVLLQSYTAAAATGMILTLLACLWPRSSPVTPL